MRPGLILKSTAEMGDHSLFLMTVYESVRGTNTFRAVVLFDSTSPPLYQVGDVASDWWTPYFKPSSMEEVVEASAKKLTPMSYCKYCKYVPKEDEWSNYEMACGHDWVHLREGYNGKL